MGKPRVLALSLAGLALFLAWQALDLRRTIQSETRPPAWDQAIHLEIALDYKEALKAGRLSDAYHLAPKPGMPPFPPAYHLGLLAALGGEDPAGAALWLNWFYLAVLCVCLFGLAWHFRPDESALLATVIFACTPAVSDLLHTQLIDLSLVAWATALYWALIRSDLFRAWAASLAVGALFAVGMLHKWSFFSYLFPMYYYWLKALSDPKRRLPALAAAALGLGAAAPWYWSHLPIMLPRLFQASADFAVPFWKGGAFFNYFWECAAQLGPAFWLLSFIGLLVPQYKREGHRGVVLALWVLTAYVFWAVVPNRQMRFLLPGLPALAVAGLGAWPNAVLWLLAGFQAFTAANYTAGWVSRLVVPTPFHDLVFLPSDPPMRQDWRIADILKEAERRADPEEPVANVVLVANDTRFNGPNFVWTAKLLKLPKVRMRGVNKRLCELAQFVVLKTDKLGPKGVTEGLPEAAKLISDPDSWFARGYERAESWPLPDGSSAVLYQRKRPAAPPFKGRRLAYEYLDAGAFSAARLKLEFGDWDAARSAWRTVRLTAAELNLRGMKVEDLAVELEDALFIPLLDYDGSWKDVRLLKLGRLRIVSARVSAEAFAGFLRERAKGLMVEALEVDGSLRVRGTLHGLRVGAEATAQLLDSPRRLRVELLGAKLGVTALPRWLWRRFQGYTLPLEPNPETPFFIELPGLTLKDGISIP